MEPTIMTGDVILIKAMETYDEKDVVTFKEQGERIVTHRILKETEKAGNVEFITKGDANRSIDNDVVKPENIMGKVMFIVPKLGFLATFVRTPIGIALMIIIPGFLIVMDRVIKIKSAKPSNKNLYT
jgi:signal peptidase